jgi:hypothetical protein
MNIYTFFRLTGLLATTFYGGMAFAGTAEGSCLATYRPDRVQLVGRIVPKLFYGEPGFGENPAIDRKERVLLLRLDKPLDITAAGNPDAESFSHVELIQLSGTPGIMKNLRSMGRARVMLAGVLDMATTGHDHTDVVISVEKIEQASTTQSTRCMSTVNR